MTTTETIEMTRYGAVRKALYAAEVAYEAMTDSATPGDPARARAASETLAYALRVLSGQIPHFDPAPMAAGPALNARMDRLAEDAIREYQLGRLIGQEAV